MRKAKRFILLILTVIIFCLTLTTPAYCDNLADKIAEKFKGIFKWFAETLLIQKIAGFVANFMFVLKEVGIMLADKLFGYVQTFIVKIWDFTDANNTGTEAIGVGAQASNMMTGKIYFVFIALAGILIYFFAMQGALAYMISGENPVKSFTNAGFAIALLIVYPLVYSFIN